MTSIGRRAFLGVFGAGVVGALAALTGCSDSDGNPASSDAAAIPAALDGVALAVHRDPG